MRSVAPAIPQKLCGKSVQHVQDSRSNEETNLWHYCSRTLLQMHKDHVSKSALSAGVAQDTSSPRIFNMAVQQTHNKCVRSTRMCGLWGSEGLGLRLAALMTQHNRHLPFRRLQKLLYRPRSEKTRSRSSLARLGMALGTGFACWEACCALRRRLMRLTHHLLLAVELKHCH